MVWRGALVFVIACGRIGFDDNDLDRGLVGYWPLDDGTGSTAADFSGNNNPGILGGNAAFTSSGRIGGAVAFDGIATSVRIADPPSGVLDFGTGSFTYSLWVDAAANVADFDTPLWKGGSSTFYVGYDCELGIDPWRAGLTDGLVRASVDLGPGALDTWTLVTIVVDRASQTIIGYRDGAAVDQVDISAIGSVSTEAVMIGQTTSGSFHGAIDDTRIYNRSLAPAEVLALAGP
jgi:concanavalin A-like lectin/glucanase superfamily protein